MKKLLTWMIISGAAVYGIGYFKLSESSAARYLGEIDQLTIEGKGDEICHRAHDDLELKLSDESGEGSAQEVEGGREEFCNVYKAATQGLAGLNVSINTQRDDFEVKRNWLHPWTADYTFHEKASLRIPQAGVSISTESDVDMQLVFTFTGVKIRKYDSVTTSKLASRN